MSWGYHHGTTGIETDLQRNKQLINETELGTKVYKTSVGRGICQIIVFWHDSRKSKFDSYAIIKTYLGSKCFNISHLKTQKEIFSYLAEQIKKL